MDRYAGHHEIRFKITDQEVKLFQDTANYFYYEKYILQKPSIQELARWCIKNAVNASQDLVIQAKQVRQQQQQQLLQQQIKQQQMWQKQLNNSAPSPLLGYNLQQQQQQQNQQKQQQKLPSIDDILAEEERRILSDLESLML
jgi:hypothetical protein